MANFWQNSCSVNPKASGLFIPPGLQFLEHLKKVKTALVIHLLVVLCSFSFVTFSAPESKAGSHDSLSGGTFMTLVVEEKITSPTDGASRQSVLNKDLFNPASGYVYESALAREEIISQVKTNIETFRVKTVLAFSFWESKSGNLRL